MVCDRINHNRGSEGEVITHTLNVKRKTRECRVGSGGALSAKQEKLGPMLSYRKTQSSEKTDVLHQEGRGDYSMGRREQFAWNRLRERE